MRGRLRLAGQSSLILKRPLTLTLSREGRGGSEASRQLLFRAG